MKLACQPTEGEALQSVLVARTPSILPTKTKKWAGRKVPDGTAQFNPISPEWKTILEDKDIAKECKEAKGKGKGKGKKVENK